MKKRALTLFLALVMCLSLCTPAMAEENFSVTMQPSTGDMVEPNADRYEYKTEFINPNGDHTTIAAYDELVPGQPTMGTYVYRGSNLFYINGGGPKITASIQYQLPGDLSSVYVGVSFDSSSFKDKSETGASITLAEDQEPGYYHIRIIHEKLIRPYVTYYRLKGSSDAWKLSSTSYIVIDDNYRETPYLALAS